MQAFQDPANNNEGRVLAYSPSVRELERRRERKRLSRRKAFIAATSSVIVLGALALIVVMSPGWPVVQSTFFDWNYGQRVIHTVVLGLRLNVVLTLVAGVSIFALALCLALIRTSRSPALTPLRILATAYVDIFRGVPLLLVIFLVGFGVPALRLQGLPSNVTVLGTVAVVLTYSAYVSEVLRSGILSVHPSQRSAARSLGLSQSQTTRYVVLPQAFKRVIPPLLNDLVALMKDTGLVSILGVVDAIRAAQIHASRSFNFTPYVVAAILFLMITIPLTRYTDRVLERSIARQNAQGVA